jgi:hypothetical protein
MSSLEENTELQSVVKNKLNQHGYAFAQAVFKIFKEQFTKQQSQWSFQTMEQPFEVKNNSGRIDIVLKDAKRDIYLVVECKRANPATKNWCFFRIPVMRFNRTNNPFIAQQIFLSVDQVNGPVSYRTDSVDLTYHTDKDTYHLGIETKTNEVGNSSGSTKSDEIEHDLSQVCKGMNGLVELIISKPSTYPSNRKITIIPLIITTANLFTSDANLENASILTGNYEDDLNLTQAKWLYLQYPQTPGIIHKYNILSNNDLPSLYDSEFLRTVCIVNASHLSNFLKAFNSDLFNID